MEEQSISINQKCHGPTIYNKYTKGKPANKELSLLQRQAIHIHNKPFLVQNLKFICTDSDFFSTQKSMPNHTKSRKKGSCLFRPFLVQNLKFICTDSDFFSTQKSRPNHTKSRKKGSCLFRPFLVQNLKLSG